MRFVLIVLLIGSVSLNGQSDFEKQYHEQYESNIKKEFINDVYIPANFEEAFEELGRLSDPSVLETFKNAEEEIVSRKLHFGLGRWMVVNWNFEDGSRLSHLMKEYGVTFPDDMTQLMIRSFHRYLNQKPLDIEGLAKYYVDTRKKELDKRKKRISDTLVRNN